MDERNTDRADLLRALDRLLIVVEPIRDKLAREIDRKVEAKRALVKHYNEVCSDQMGSYSTEFRRALEAELQPLADAIRDGNAALEAASTEVRP